MLVGSVTYTQLTCVIIAPGQECIIGGAGHGTVLTGKNVNDLSTHHTGSTQLHPTRYANRNAGSHTGYTQLAIGIAAPCKELTIPGQRHGMAGTGSHTDHLVDKIAHFIIVTRGNLKRDVGHTAHALLFVTQLAGAVITPGKQCTIYPNGHSVSAAGSNVNYVLQIAIALIPQDSDRLAGAGAGGSDTQLAGAVEAPSVHFAVAGQCHRETASGGNGNDLLVFRQTGHRYRGAVIRSTTVTQLMVIIVAPGVNLPLIGKGQEEVLSHLDINDIFVLCHIGAGEIHLNRILFSMLAGHLHTTAAIIGIMTVLAPKPNCTVCPQRQVGRTGFTIISIVAVTGSHFRFSYHVVSALDKFCVRQNHYLIITPIVGTHMLYRNDNGAMTAAGGNQVPLTIQALEIGDSGVGGGHGEARSRLHQTANLIVDQVEGAVIDLNQGVLVDPKLLISLQGNRARHLTTLLHHIGGVSDLIGVIAVEGLSTNFQGIIVTVAHLGQKLGIIPVRVAALSCVIQAGTPNRALLPDHDAKLVTGSQGQILTGMGGLVSRNVIQAGDGAALKHLHRQIHPALALPVHTQLAVNIAAPAHHSTVSNGTAILKGQSVLHDGQAVVSAGSHLPHAGKVVASVLIENHLGNIGAALTISREQIAYTQTSVGIIAPSESKGLSFPIYGAQTGRQGKTRPCGNLENIIQIKILLLKISPILIHNGLYHLDRNCRMGHCFHAKLTCGVFTPSPYSTIGPERHALVAVGRNLNNVG